MLMSDHNELYDQNARSTIHNANISWILLIGRSGGEKGFQFPRFYAGN